MQKTTSKVPKLREFYLICKLLYVKEVISKEEYVDLVSNNPLDIINDIEEGLYEFI